MSSYFTLICPVTNHCLKSRTLSPPIPRPGGSKPGEFDAAVTQVTLQSGPGLLARAQTTKFTIQGEPVTEIKIKLVKTQQLLAALMRNPYDRIMDMKWRASNGSKFSDMSMITDYLALTGVGGLYRDNFKVFDKSKLKYIFNVSNEAPKLKIKDVKFYRIPVEDANTCTCEKLQPYFDEVTDLMDTAIRDRKVVLVHCWRGISRSATIVMAYLIKHQKKTFEEAFKMVKDKRRVVRPAVIFMQQLADLEKQVHGREMSPWGIASFGDKERKLPDFILKNPEYFASYKNAFPKSPFKGTGSTTGGK